MQAPYSRTLSDLLDEQAARRAEALAVISGDMRLTYAELAERARRVAGVLRARGDRVGLLINNRPEWLEAAFSAWMLGAVAVPFST